MKKMLIIMIILMLILPISIGLLCYKSPIMLPETVHVKKITCLETETNKIRNCDLENYLVGVLAAEMPAEYHIEALKAQSVAARSFIISRINEKNPDHPTAAVCDNPNHCKAHLDEAVARQKWSESKADEYWDKLERAVAETAGEYMMCGEEVVEAFFFARSSGKTENSEDVWGEERPYLKSVESYGDKTHPEYETTVEFKTADARSRLKGLNDAISAGAATLNIGEIIRTAGDSVAEIVIDGQRFSGKDIRYAFGLRSANFSVTTDLDKVYFRVLGYGHGVGMSQFGANYMAENGKKYTEILNHYYTNIQIISS